MRRHLEVVTKVSVCTSYCLQDAIKLWQSAMRTNLLGVCCASRGYSLVPVMLSWASGVPLNILLGPLMPSSLARPRTSAFFLQSGHCFYCDLPMLTGSPAKFAKRYGITVAQAKLMRCTGEHLIPRENGGKGDKTNIAATCWFCNSHRHRRPVAPAPVDFNRFVRQRNQQGRWHSLNFRKPDSASTGGNRAQLGQDRS